MGEGGKQPTQGEGSAQAQDDAIANALVQRDMHHAEASRNVYFVFGCNCRVGRGKEKKFGNVRLQCLSTTECVYLDMMSQ